MLSSHPARLTLAVLILGGLALPLAAQPPAAPPSLTPVAPPAAAEDLLKVPDGTPAELIEYLDKLVQMQPPATGSREERVAFLQKVLPALVEAGDKILAGKPTEEQAGRGFSAKMQGLVQMKMLGAPGIDQKLEQLPEQMKQAGFPKLEQAAKMILLQLAIREAMQQGPAEVEAAVTKAVQALEAAPVSPMNVQFIDQLGQISQMIEKPEMVVSLYQKYGQALSSDPNPQFQEAGKRMLGTVNRLTSVGKPIKLEGVFLDGTKLDWQKQFGGKVVLVTFWASWCGPCRQEIEHLMKVYPYYHPKGFEVLGINLDEEKSKAEEFVKENNIPWPTLVSATEGKTAFDDPNAVYYGVSGIPTVMIVGKDGKVTALGVRGEKLDAMLAELFGPMPAETDQAEPAPQP